MADEWLKKGFVPQAFADYISDEAQVAFPWSMIDKITPRPADSVCAELEKLGCEAIAPVITSKRTYIAPFVNAEQPAVSSWWRIASRTAARRWSRRGCT